MLKSRAGLGRRPFVLGVAAAACTGMAQVPKEPVSVRRVGVLLADGPPTSSPTPLEQKLRELSTASQQIQVEVHFGARDQLQRHAETLAAGTVDLIVANGTPAALAAQRATNSIPIVYVIAGDPVESGLAQSLQQPGGNATGIYGLNTETSGKRVSLLLDAAPGTKAVGLLWTPQRLSEIELANGRAAAEAVQLRIMRLDVTTRDDIEPRFKELRRNGTEVVSVLTTPVLFDNLQLVADLALRHRIPTIAAYRGFAALGGLMSYTADADDLLRSTVELAGKVLNGTRPMDLPVQRAKRFELTLNVKTASTIGVVFSPTLKLQAQRIIG
jgi:putative ABC transport system substrate-binding protein